MCACVFVLIPLDIHVEWDHSTSHSTFSFDGRRLLRPQDPCKALWKQSGSAALAYTPLRRTHSLTSYVLGSLRAAAPSSCWGLHLDSLSAPTASSLCGVNDETLSSYAPWACHAYATISAHRLPVAYVDMRPTISSRSGGRSGGYVARYNALQDVFAFVAK